MSVNFYTRDLSFRTARVKKAQYALVAAVVAVCLGCIGYIAGSWHYGTLIAQSSTAVGSKLLFQRSNAECKLSGLYTDAHQNVLIARVSFASKADATKLPYRGTDYAVFVNSDAIPSNVKEIDMLTGRISSDGDMFIVLPKPDKSAVYSVFIMNTKYLGVDDTDKQQDGNASKGVVDINNVKGSLSSALSKYKYDVANGAISDKAITVKRDSADVAAFRMTLSPAVNDEAHTPEQLQVDLLRGDKFEYRSFFKAVFIDNAKAQLTAEFKTLDKNKKLLQAQLNEYTDRLRENSDDTAAKAAFTRANTDLTKLRQRQANIAGLLSSYSGLVYSNTLFDNVNNTAYVLKR